MNENNKKQTRTTKKNRNDKYDRERKKNNFHKINTHVQQYTQKKCSKTITYRVDDNVVL